MQVFVKKNFLEREKIFFVEIQFFQSFFFWEIVEKAKKRGFFKVSNIFALFSLNGN